MSKTNTMIRLTEPKEKRKYILEIPYKDYLIGICIPDKKSSLIKEDIGTLVVFHNSKGKLIEITGKVFKVYQNKNTQQPATAENIRLIMHWVDNELNNPLKVIKPLTLPVSRTYGKESLFSRNPLFIE